MNNAIYRMLIQLIRNFSCSGGYLRNYVIFILLLIIPVLSCTPGAPIIITYDAAPQLINAGEKSIITWKVNGVSTISIEPNIGILPSSGSQTVFPSTTTTYTIKANNGRDSVSRSITVAVRAQPVNITFDASPSMINTGGSSRLSWNVSGADAVTIDQGIGSVPAAGSLQVTPSSTTAYILTADNSNSSVAKSAIVTVNNLVAASFSESPLVTFEAVPATLVNSGDSATLRWEVKGASSVKIDQNIGEVPPAGSLSVSPAATTSYTLVANNSCCTVSKTTVVTVGTLYPDPASFFYGRSRCGCK